MKTNKFGVKPGDIFICSWGYEQTNVDFYQVVSLAGESSVRVRQVVPEIVNESYNDPMSGTFTYKLQNEMLPPVERSLFIKDQENGDIKRLKCFDRAGKYPTFNVASYATATKVDKETITTYESWYA